MIEVVETPRGRIEYRIDGQGRPILLLGGGHTDCRSPFEHERYLLDHGFKVIAPSRPGYGRTPASSGKTAEEAADAMAALLDVLRVGRAVVFGIAAGGRTALQLAGRHPDRVERMVLECAVTCEPWPSKGARVFSTMFFNPVIEGLSWGVFRLLSILAPRKALPMVMKRLSSMDSSAVAGHMKPETQKRVLEFLRAQRSRSGFLLDIRHESGDLGRVTAPTLIVASMYDGAVSARHAEEAAARIKGSKFLVVPAESHLVWFSPYKDDIEQKISSFLG